MLDRAIRILLSFLLFGVFSIAAPALAQSVGMARLHIVDTGRADPVAPIHRREWMVTLFYPSPEEGGPHSPYAADPALVGLLADNGYYDTPATEILAWSRTAGPAVCGARAVAARLPLITLSPGLGVAAFNYSRLAAELARRGFAVAVIDHPYVGLSRLPDGRLLRADDYAILGKESMSDWRPAIVEWARDISVTLDRLSSESAIATGLDLDAGQAVAVGHSLGGTLALEACERERRLTACANFEGTPEGTVVAEQGPSKPVLFVGSRSGKPGRPHVAPAVDRPPYSAFANGTGPATWLVAMRGGSHMSYSDAPFVMPATLSRVGGELMTAERSLDVYAGMTERFARTYLRMGDLGHFAAWLGSIPEVKFRLIER